MFFPFYSSPFNVFASVWSVKSLSARIFHITLDLSVSGNIAFPCRTKSKPKSYLSLLATLRQHLTAVRCIIT